MPNPPIPPFKGPPTGGLAQVGATTLFTRLHHTLLSKMFRALSQETSSVRFEGHMETMTLSHFE